MARTEHIFSTDGGPVERLLRKIAALELSPFSAEQVCEDIDLITNWPALLARAESHGLSALLDWHVDQINPGLERTVQRQLHTLRFRHRHANSIRHEVLKEIAKLCAASGIPMAVIKGAALSHMIYPYPELRPMRDIDILVDSGDVDQVTEILENLQFSVPKVHDSRFMQGHHHLPPCSKMVDGLHVSIEVHTDALSGDQDACIIMPDIRSRLYQFADGDLYTLPPATMLEQVSRHAFEPAGFFRLIHLVDIVELYRRFYPDPIQSDSRECRHGLNALLLMGQLRPLPLRDMIKGDKTRRLEGAGRSMPPLSSAAGEGRISTVTNLLFPPPWWLHGFYGLHPDRSTGWLRICRHWPRMLFWLWRRLKWLR